MTPSIASPGIYLHIPFCRRKCPYCDFYSETGPPERRTVYLAALEREMALRAATVHEPPDSLYFGGGTPSLLSPEQILALIERSRRFFGLAADAEITLEANPGTVGRETLEGLRAAGINRLNLGIQSFSDASLTFLGRIHSAAEACRSIDEARRAGFDDIGLDLIYGLPGQRPRDWRADLEVALAAAPVHLSCYMLTYAAGTPMDKDRLQGRIRPLPEEAVAGLFELTVETLTASGFVHYEVSNFACGGSPPAWSRHNRKYWNGGPYFGFGPAAHSFDGSRRSWNEPDLDAYQKALGQGRLPAGGREVLTREQRMTEAVFLGLRQSEGIDMGDFQTRFAVDAGQLFGRVMADLVDEGLAASDGRRFWLTRRGLLVADAAALRLAACF